MDDYDWNILSDAYDKAKAELATLRAEVERLRENLTAMVKRHRESHQNWTQAAVCAQRSGNYSLSVDIQNTALVALSGFPIEEAKEALK